MFICDNQLLLFEVFSECMKVKWPVITPLHILVGNHIVIGWLLVVIIFMKAYPTHYDLRI
jgi:hypothetical protein